MKLAQAFTIWSSLLCALAMAGLIWAFFAATDPSFLMIAALQSIVIASGLFWIYLTTARLLWKQSAQARRALVRLVFLWAGITGFLILAWIMPNESKDEVANHRYALGISATLFITLVQIVFWARTSGATE